MPIRYEQTEVDNFEIYTNEPAECKWSHTDQDYENMENSFVCSNNLEQINSQMLYTCTTKLTGLKDRAENKFYFRCKDQPNVVEESKRNTDKQSYEFTLLGTQPLYIDEFEPKNTTTIKDSTASIKVTLKAKTAEGYKDGEAICYYSDNDENYIQFYNTNSYTHSQDLYLPEGDYTYYIKCVDLGGNSDKIKTSFHVESDTESPIIVRAYNEENKLKIITNELARCYYSNQDCNFQLKDGIEMQTIDNINHFTDWSTQNSFYIKCEDEYGNQPAGQDVCSIIVRPSEIQNQE